MPVLSPRERLVVALDVPAPERARRLVDALAGAVGMFKVNAYLFTGAGPAFVRELVDGGERVFLDLKYHDIPSVVGSAVARACALGASLVTVHALGGRAMLEEAARARAGTTTRVLAITVLTSHAQDALAELGLPADLPGAVRRLAVLACEAGVDGVVASPHEIRIVRQACGPEFLVVTPGIRPPGAAAGDQARVATPREALAAGADYLVVGRPVTQAADPAEAAERLVAEMADAPGA
jgi:orotidine-5'-phosphate decarboxylase